MVLGDMSFSETLSLGMKIYSGAHLDMPKVKRLQGRKLVATSDEIVRIDADGEEPGILPATFEILPGTVRMKQLRVKCETIPPNGIGSVRIIGDRFDDKRLFVHDPVRRKKHN